MRYRQFLLLGFFLIGSVQGYAMGLFDFYKANVLTAMSGVVTFDGKPVKGIKAVLDVRVVFNNKKWG